MSGLLKVSFTILLLHSAVSGNDSFLFNGFRGANMSLDGEAKIAADGLLSLCNATKGKTGHAFSSTPLHFRGSPSGAVMSFSTTFVFKIVPVAPQVSTHGMAFVISPTKKPAPEPYNGSSSTNDRNATKHILSVVFDATVNSQFRGMDKNHVWVDADGVTSFNYSSGLTHARGQPMQAWVEYDGRAMQLAVALAPVGRSQPDIPLLSSSINLSGLFLEPMYAGFSAAAGRELTAQYVLGWSFRVNGKAEALDLSSLPSLGWAGNSKRTNPLAIWLPIALALSLLVVTAVLTLVVARKRRFAEVREDWELEYGPHRFSYKDLYRATKGFRASELLGVGGFGEVYRGVIPVSKMEVAVKKVSHDSRQGMREFVAEIVTTGRLRHRNLVQLLGYSRRRGGLFLVYDFMPNGSLDRFLFDGTGPTLSWVWRFHVIKGVAAGLLYLHEEWENVVIHRDVKASNVLLDGEFNGRLGDFGLSRLYDHGTGPQTTHVVGTAGYMAPELARSGKATKATDVYAYGAFLLEVACGKRPVEPVASGEDLRLVHWVLQCWSRGDVLEAADPRLSGEYQAGEVALVMMVGLHCSHPSPASRPSMRQVVQLLDGDAALPELSLDEINGARRAESGGLTVFDDMTPSYSSSAVTDSVLSGGR